jgi:hypothetical protein
MKTGNSELLEADIACAQILPRGRRTQGKVAEQLHQWLLGGMQHYSIPSVSLELTFIQGRN